MLQDKVHLITTISDLKEVDHLNSKVEGMTKSARMLNSCSKTLNEILGVGKTTRDMKRVKFNYGSLSSKIKFVPLTKKTKFIMSKYKSQHLTQHHSHYSNAC